PTRVRKCFVVAGLFMGTLVVPAALVEDRVLCVTLLVAASLCYGMCSSNLWAITQTLAGPAASGKWTGLPNGFRHLAGEAAAFVAAALAAAVGGISFLLVVGKVEPIEWKPRST